MSLYSHLIIAVHFVTVELWQLETSGTQKPEMEKLLSSWRKAMSISFCGALEQRSLTPEMEKRRSKRRDYQ